jgi:hypothetical protein
VARREVLAGAALLLVGVLLQQALVQVAQALAVALYQSSLSISATRVDSVAGFLMKVLALAKISCTSTASHAAEVDQRLL